MDPVSPEQKQHIGELALNHFYRGKYSDMSLSQFIGDVNTYLVQKGYNTTYNVNTGEEEKHEDW